MKMRINRKDLAALTQSQKQRLNEIWIPERYDAAVVCLCKDVTKDEYEEMEFVIGAIELSTYGHMTLHDLRSPVFDAPKEDTCDIDGAQNNAFENTGATDDVTSASLPFLGQKELKIQNEEISSSEINDEDSDEFGFEFEAPGAFNKEDCFPLLNIGQMIDMLKRYNFGKYDFYMTVSTYEITCELGNINSIKDNSYNECESAELCDVLWESVKALLGASSS